MRQSSWIFTTAELVVLAFIYWVASPVWVQAGEEINTASAEFATGAALVKESPTLDSNPSGKTPEPTRSPRPTPTPIRVPPPSNPNTTQTLVIFGVLVVVVVIFGLLLNRNRVF